MNAGEPLQPAFGDGLRAAPATNDRELYRIFELLPVACLVLDANGVILDGNVAAAGLLGLDSRWLPGKPLIAHLDPSCHTEFWRLRQRLMPTASLPLAGELTVMRRDGQRIPVRMEVAGLSERQGRSLVCSLTDLRERRLTEQALTAARRAAEEAVRTRSLFLANMSHELRTPLTGVIGMLDLLHEEVTTELQKDMVDTAAGAARALTKLIGDILDLTRLEGGRIELDRVPFDVRQVAEEALGTVVPQAAAKNLQLVLETSPRLPTRYEGDPHRLRQILVNLLGNAVKFTERGFVEVSLAPLSDSAGRTLLSIAVRDSGPGIPVDRMAKLFQRFEQGDPSMTRLHGGSGLGLSIARQLAVLMGGRIGVESEVGFGTCFTAEVALRELAPPPLEPAPGSAGTWIVLEDRELTRRYLEGCLRRLGAGVISTATLEEALAAGTPTTPRLCSAHLVARDADRTGLTIYGSVPAAGQLLAPLLPARIARLLAENCDHE